MAPLFFAFKENLSPFYLSIAQENDRRSRIKTLARLPYYQHIIEGDGLDFWLPQSLPKFIRIAQDLDLDTYKSDPSDVRPKSTFTPTLPSGNSIDLFSTAVLRDLDREYKHYCDK
ncbi:hypothetical protein NDU88_010557 [Pleurodeles waltl]|uniref:Uncharacterized protein n=1 Tax=Pleurodeles waltl TaxID=8319 RepID=A0AAV7Q2J6_PLEWA|nr:hypothetical protein NDU88_010557 [Pleurodeles waltl]